VLPVGCHVPHLLVGARIAQPLQFLAVQLPDHHGDLGGRLGDLPLHGRHLPVQVLDRRVQRVLFRPGRPGLHRPGDVVALDGKMNFDDNALFRHPAVEALRDEDEEDASELEAKKHGLSYVNLDGNIGCMVNGAGLAMATMDIIKHYGGEPANFLDVGGSATKETVTEAFKIITADARVEAIFINIFGGIMRCDVIAEGVIAAVKEVGLQVPLVVRLAGTNDKEGKAILSKSDLNIIAADTMADGAQKVVAAIS